MKNFSTYLHQEDNMEKQRINSLIVDESTLAEDIADYIDENDVGDSNILNASILNCDWSSQCHLVSGAKSYICSVNPTNLVL